MIFSITYFPLWLILNQWDGDGLTHYIIVILCTQTNHKILKFFECRYFDSSFIFLGPFSLSNLILALIRTQISRFGRKAAALSITHESLKFFKKCGFFAIFGKRILRYARVSLWRRSPTGELPSNPAPKATFLEKNRTFVDDCVPPNVPKMWFFERFQGLSDLNNWPTLGVFFSKKIVQMVKYRPFTYAFTTQFILR